MSIEDSFTEKQVENWPRAINRLTSTGATVSEYAWNWNVAFYGESHSGHDRDFVASYLDSDVVAQICMDVYGSFATSWAELDWVHADDDEQCGCGCKDGEDEA